MDTFLSTVSFLVSSIPKTFVQENSCFWGGGGILESDIWLLRFLGLPPRCHNTSPP